MKTVSRNSSGHLTAHYPRFFSSASAQGQGSPRKSCRVTEIHPKGPVKELGYAGAAQRILSTMVMSGHTREILPDRCFQALISVIPRERHDYLNENKGN